MLNVCEKELKNHIIPFWNNLRDERGGFYGRVTQRLEVMRDAPKGVVLHARILWFYSEAYRLTGDDSLIAYAEHAYRFITEKCIDKSRCGVFWMMHPDGTPADTMKYTYCQAFAVYALSAYARAFGDKEALKIALSLFDCIEECARDEVFYGDAFTVDWESSANNELSENGVSADKTMNTALHLIEAYTELLRVSGERRVETSLRYLLKITVNNIYDNAAGKLRVFFDYNMNEVGDIHSYGHDIEASWLLDRACEVLGDEELSAKLADITLRIADNVYELAFRCGSLFNERDGNKIDTKRVWWVQAEAAVGFLNAYTKSSDERYLRASKDILNFILTYQLDKRSGEWFPELDADFAPIEGFDMAGPWKCPYHTGRMCIELIRRISNNA